MGNSVDYARMWSEAQAAYRVAYEAAKPQQFLVGDAVNFFSNEIDKSKPVYVMDGLCGFAWVSIGDGRKPFARWAAKNAGAYKDYYGGFAIWSSEFMKDQGQSMERKVAGCRAAVAVFKEYGVEAFVRSRVD